MQAILKHCTAVLDRFIFIGFSVQIVLGILWMWNAFAGLKKPGEGIFCVGAMLLLGAAVWLALTGLSEGKVRWRDAWILLSVMTFPFVMQSLVKPDIRVFVTAVFLCILGRACRMFSRPGEGKDRRFAVVLGFFVLTTGLTVGTDFWQNGWTPWSVRLTERMVWTTLYDTYAELPEETRESIDYFTMVESTYEPIGMRKLLVPCLTEDLGEEGAAKALAEFRDTAWHMNKKQVLKEIFWDAAGYWVSPLVVELQLAGRAYDSYTGMNYRDILQPAPKLGKLYMDYGCWWFGVALVSAALTYVLRSLMTKRRPAMERWMVVEVICMCMVVYHTLNGAGRMDYKNTLSVLCVWLLWMAGGVRGAED